MTNDLKRKLTIAFLVVGILVAVIAGGAAVLLYFAAASPWAMVAVAAIGVLAIVLTAGFALSLGQQAAALASEAAELKQNLNQSFVALAEAEVEQGRLSSQSAATIASLESELNEINSLITKLTNGDFSAVTQNWGKTLRSNAAKDLFVYLGEICGDLRGLAASGANGNLKAVLGVEKYRGDWQKMAEEINRAVATFVLPIEQARIVCEGFAQGKLDGKITAETRGDLQLLKTAVNNASGSLSKYVNGIAQALQGAASKGRSYAELPGDFAPLKDAISAVADLINQKPSVRENTAGAATSRSGDLSARFSGAAKKYTALPNMNFDFKRKDFGKY